MSSILAVHAGFLQVEHLNHRHLTQCVATIHHLQKLSQTLSRVRQSFVCSSCFSCSSCPSCSSCFSSSS